MRQVTFRVGLSLVLLTGGCNNAPHNRNQNQGITRLPPDTPKAAQLVTYLNDNAHRVQAIQCTRVAIDCKQGREAIGLDGLLVCQKPRNFRLKAKVVGQPAVDIGSNKDEFWYWISKAEPPYVYHCSYPDLARGNIAMPFPFQPDMIIAALGIGEYDENKPYQVKASDQYLELIENTVSPQGQPVQKVTVFNRTQVAPGRPQVVGHLLRDAQGKLICKATVHEVEVNRETNAVLPRRVVLEWPGQQIMMDLRLYGTQVVNIDPQRADKLFQRQDLASIPSYDLAHPPARPGFQRASIPAR
jgi:hypothetical protein